MAPGGPVGKPISLGPVGGFRPPARATKTSDGSALLPGRPVVRLPAVGVAAPGEREAMRVMREVQGREERRLQAYEAKKRKHRKEYDIGWKVERIPQNKGLASKMECELVENHGLCCLVYDEKAKSVQVVEKPMPASCVNLEYLSLALQVRLHAGREPLFSLDPKEGDDDKDAGPDGKMQKKRFEPEWLMGTSVGEVMWQADYHLKELSFGEFEQPIIGMKSAFDYDEEEGRNKEWMARVWFVVKDAAVYITDDNFLVPHIVMGVEAREQTKENGHTRDAKVTRENHPMKKYSDSFTRNFDLIAERKSVVYHLRELAKASIIAKFMLEAQVELNNKWFDLVDWSKVKNEAASCVLEVPQLWNDRVHSNVKLRNGRVVGGDVAISTSTISLYGGVEFGLGQFNVRNPRQLPPQMAAGASLSAISMTMSNPRQLRPASSLMSSMATPARVGASITATTTAMMRTPHAMLSQVPRGVDLNLDQFDLAEVRKAGVQDVRGALIGDAFWKLLNSERGSEPVGEKSAQKEYHCDADQIPTIADAEHYDEDERRLLQEVFNPHLSDRRAEGQLFVGPDLSQEYAQKLRELLDEEAKIRKQRMDHFLSPEFAVGDAGPLFPTSWSFSIEITQALGLPARVLPPPGFHLEGLKAAGPPVFDKSTEDGLRFRIYMKDGFEARTIQEHDGKEVLGALFRPTGESRMAPGKDDAVNRCDRRADAGSSSSSSSSGLPAQREKTLKCTVARTAAPQCALEAECKESRKKVPESERKARLASLIYSNGALRSDKEVVMAAVEQDGLTLERAADELKADREVVQAAVQERGSALEFAAEGMRADKEVVMTAIEVDATAIEHASEELRADREVALSAVKRNSFALKSVAPGLRSEREMILAAVQRNAYALEHASADLLEDRDFLLAVIRKNALVLDDVPRKWRADRDFMMEVVSFNGFALKYASKQLRADGELVARAVEQDSRAMEYGDNEAYRRYLEKKRLSQVAIPLPHVEDEWGSERLDEEPVEATDAPETEDNPPAAPERWTCSKCDEPNKMQRELCNNCGAPKPGAGTEVKTCPQGHKLIAIDIATSGSWCCDGCESQPAGIERFRCQACDYDLCKTCVSHKA